MYTSVTSVLTRRYVLVLGLLFAVSLAAFLIFEELLRSQVSAEIVNSGGRERMLTHRIALYSTLLVGSAEEYDPTEIRSKLLASVEELRIAHDFLVGQRSSMFGPFGVGRASDRQTFEDELRRLDASINRVIADATFVATATESDTLRARKTTASLIDAATVSLIADLERVVTTYLGISQQRLRWLHTFAAVGEIAIASLLLFLGLAVFRPLVRDIDRRIKQIEHVEAYYRSILNNVGDGVVTFDKEMTIRHVNMAFEGIAGMAAHRLLGRLVVEVLPEISAVRNLFGVRSRRTEFVRRQADGTQNHYDVSVYIFEFEGDLQCIVSLRDNTERKALEKRLRTFFYAIEHSPLSIVITDIEGNIEYANRRCSEISGYAPQEIIGRNPRIFRSGKTPIEIYRELWEELLAGREWYGELLNKRKNGDLYWEFEAISPLKNERGETTHFIAIKEDITEKKKQAAALLDATRQADLANRAKSEFLANMSHELRTPLNAIIGFAEVMQIELFGPHGNDRYKEYSGAVLDSARHLLSIINDILDYSKLEAGKVKLYEEEVGLAEILDSVFLIIRERAEANQVTVMRDGDGLDIASTNLFVDPLRYKQILLNIISNAVKFTGSGGTVTVTGHRTEDGGIALAVRDTGIGIKEEDIPRALERFGQVESIMVRKYEGTGLGLPISKALVELHGGTLTLQSKSGVGTTATVTLPASRVKAT